MELVRERELRETLERQLSVEQKNRGTHSGNVRLEFILGVDCIVGFVSLSRSFFSCIQQ